MSSDRDDSGADDFDGGADDVDGAADSFDHEFDEFDDEADEEGGRREDADDVAAEISSSIVVPWSVPVTRSSCPARAIAGRAVTVSPGQRTSCRWASSRSIWQRR